MTFFLSLFSAMTGSRASPKSLLPLKGAKASFHLERISAFQCLSHKRHRVVTLEARDLEANLAAFRAASAVYSVAAIILLTSCLNLVSPAGSLARSCLSQSSTALDRKDVEAEVLMAQATA